jgi:hypothetical protein
MGSSIISTSEKDTCLLRIDDDEECEDGERWLEPNWEVDRLKFNDVDEELRGENDMMPNVCVCSLA